MAALFGSGNPNPYVAMQVTYNEPQNKNFFFRDHGIKFGSVSSASTMPPPARCSTSGTPSEVYTPSPSSAEAATSPSSRTSSAGTGSDFSREVVNENTSGASLLEQLKRGDAPTSDYAASTVDASDALSLSGES